MKYEEPTAYLRQIGTPTSTGTVLQQLWKVFEWYDEEATCFKGITDEWRDVPIELRYT